VETSLQSLFLQKIQMLRESTLAHFKSATPSEAMPCDFTLPTADSMNSHEGEDAYSLPRSRLPSSMPMPCSASKCSRFMCRPSISSHSAAVAAYRPLDTDIIAGLSSQLGRTNIQRSMVPDESTSLLGPNGFTAGVGPENLGLSFNPNVYRTPNCCRTSAPYYSFGRLYGMLRLGRLLSGSEASCVVGGIPRSLELYFFDRASVLCLMELRWAR
jgi:hypothetical protein